MEIKSESKEIEPRAKILFLQTNPWVKPHLQMAEKMFGYTGESIEKFKQTITCEIKAPRLKELPDVFERDKQAELLLPKSVDNYQAIVITGSPFTSYPFKTEDNRLLITWWKKELIDFIRKSYEHQKPILGICFGAQILTESLGGKTEKMKNKDGQELWEFGWSKVKRTMESTSDPIMEGIPAEFIVPQNHRDVISRLPEGGVLLAENEYGVQGFRVEKKGKPVAWGFQFHPERPPEVIEKMLNKDKIIDRMKKYGLDPRKIKARGKEYHHEVERIFTNFLKFIWSGAQ